MKKDDKLLQQNMELFEIHSLSQPIVNSGTVLLSKEISVMAYQEKPGYFLVKMAIKRGCS